MQKLNIRFQICMLCIKLQKTSKTGLQRAAARYDGIGKIGGGYGFLVSMVSRCPGGWGGRGGWLALDG